jgi:aryl-alcohol dehydrogenase-like predicted oxidoreductase
MSDEHESIATIHEALDLGVSFFDTAEVYGPFENEKLLGEKKGGEPCESTKFKNLVSMDWR